MKKLLTAILIILIISSVVPASYASDEELTRAEALHVILEFFGLFDYAQETEYKDMFTDVPEDYWAAGAILYAYDMGITVGTSANKFEPDLNITVAEYITFIMRYAALDTEITPENVFENYMINYITYEDINEESKTISLYAARNIIGQYDWIIHSALEVREHYTNIIQVGERASISLDEIEGLTGYEYEVDISDKSLLRYDGRLPDCHLFRALGSGKITVSITIAAPGEELLEERIYDFYILEEGKGEGVFGLDESEVNKIPIGCIASVELESNQTTGYSWEMLPNDNIELIQERYISYIVEEGIDGSGGVEILTFLMKTPGETELVLKYVPGWEPEDENPPEYIYNIIITE